jgi:hypothetical protein
MNDHSILQRYVARTDDRPARDVELDPVDDLGAFGWLRGARERAVMLELRRKDGGILAVTYGYIDKIEFDPSGCITLSAAGQRVCIHGRHLNTEVRPTVRLFEGLTRHRVPWIREADSTLREADVPEALIDRITW